MPVEISLLELVRVSDTRPLWPSDFAALIAAIEENPEERSTLGGLADYLAEGVKEPWLERATRFLMKRPTIEIVKDSKYGPPAMWSFKGLPNPWKYGLDREGEGDTCTFAGLLAHLAVSIKKQLEELE